MLRFLLPFVSVFCFLVNAQSTTITQNGATIVQVITTDVNGAPSTQVITTLSPIVSSVSSSATTSSVINAATSTTTTAAPAQSTVASPSTTGTTTSLTVVTEDPGQQGPVGQPASTTGTPHAPIEYQYTTVIDGVTTVIADIFTPTFPTTVSASVTGTGTILDYSAWLSQFGAPTATSTSAGSPLRPSMAVLLLPLMAVSCWTVTLFV